MGRHSGELAFLFLVAVAVSCLSAWVLAWRYRVAMRRLMQAPQQADAAHAASDTGRRQPDYVAPPASVTAAHNRRAQLRLAAALVVLSLLMALSTAVLTLSLMSVPGALTPHRLAVLTLVQTWPVIPALGLLWRWSRARVTAALLGWFALSFLLVMWRSDPGLSVAGLLAWLTVEIGIPLILVAAVCLGQATRAAAPWLFAPVLMLVWASMAGVDGLARLVEAEPAWLVGIVETLGAGTTLALFALVPWLLAWWPARYLGRALARAYARKRVSELLVLFAGAWTFPLLFKVTLAGGDLGIGAAAMLLPLAWVPVAALSSAAWRPRPQAPGRPPVLLVLRVFQRDRDVQALFDRVVERWRATGNTVLIAGTDLLERTLDADTLFTFIDGRLHTRFVRTRADLAPRLAAFDLAPDLDGRHRVNACLCHDQTWQDALDALVRQSDVVLMDLRHFKTHNEGCRHELRVLARAPALKRVVVLTDGETHRDIALADTAGAPDGRFVWMDLAGMDRRRAHAVLQSLFTAS